MWNLNELFIYCVILLRAWVPSAVHMWEAQCAAGDWRTHHLQQPDFSKRIPVKIFSSCSYLPSNRNKLLSWCLKNCLTVRNVVLGWHGGVILLSEWFIFSWNLKIASGLERGLRSYTEATFQGCCPYVSMFSVKPWLQSEKQHCVCVCVCVCARACGHACTWWTNNLEVREFQLWIK